MPTPPVPSPAPRAIRTAVILAVGSEITAGETKDTNGGELARSLSDHGVTVLRLAALPDDLRVVTSAFSDALAGADLVVSTGGLGPTPDDLTREAVAAVVGEEPRVDPDLEAWLEGLFARRGVPLLAVNLKQAWLIPSATPLENPNGTAPGWWVDRPDGRVVVLLPGPPREMRPMWRDLALPHLIQRGLGGGRDVRTLRTYGVGESQVAHLLGDAVLRARNPVVATYARAEWLDVRISAVDEIDADGRTVASAASLADEAETRVRETLAGHVWAEGETSWADLVAAAAGRTGVSLALVEAGTGGALGRLLADVRAVERSSSFGPAVAPDPAEWPLDGMAAGAAADSGADVGCALVARSTDAETVLRAVVARGDGTWSRSMDLRLFQHGAHGRLRAAVATAAFIVQVLDEAEPASR